METDFETGLQGGKMKKLLSGLFALILVLAGCGGAGTDGEAADGTLADKKVTIYNLKVEIDEALKAYAKTWSEQTGIEVEVKSVGGGADYGAALQAEFQSGNEPDIFVASGAGDFAQWEDVVYDMTGEAWTKDTELEYQTEDGKTVGFPVAIEGYGLIANTEILNKAGINADELKSYKDLEAAFTTLADKKADLGIENVLSFTTKETWVTGNHLFNILLGASGEEAVTSFIEGDAEALDTDNFAEFTKLLMDNSVGDLSTTDYDTEVSNFATGKSAFLFQGNWALGNLEAAGYNTENLAFVPLAYNDATAGKLAVGVPSYYAVNKNTDVTAATQFLNDMAETEAGHEYMVNEALMIPAFTNVETKPADPLSQDIMEYNAAGNTIPWLFVKFPDGYTMNTYGPIFDNYYKNGDSESFIKNIKDTAGKVN